MDRSNFFVNGLDLSCFYSNQTAPEGRIFAFSRNLDGVLTADWIYTHRVELLEFLHEKWLESEKDGKNIGLIEAARRYFGDEGNMKRLVNAISSASSEISLAELSLVVYEGSEEKEISQPYYFSRIKKRIFIPNFSVTEARKGNYRPHKTLEDFFGSNSFYLIRMISQHIAANPYSSLSSDEQNERVKLWVQTYGERAAKELRESMSFNSDKLYVEGDSPDDALLEFGHVPYSSVARKVILTK